MENLYQNIKKERLRKNWSQSELARRVGYSDKSMIAKIEAGKVDLSETKVRVFAEAFGCTESHLRGNDALADFILNAPPTQQAMFQEYYKCKEADFIAKAYLQAPEPIKEAVCKLLDVDRSFFNIDKFKKGE